MNGKLLAVLLVAISVTTVVFAYMYTQVGQLSVEIEIVLASPEIKVYEDNQLTQEVTSIQVNLDQGSTWSKTLYIHNTGIGTYSLAWISDLSTATDKITDQWKTWNGTQIKSTSIPGEYAWQTVYTIVIAADTPRTAYSWNLYIGSRHAILEHIAIFGIEWKQKSLINN